MELHPRKQFIDEPIETFHSWQGAGQITKLVLQIISAHVSDMQGAEIARSDVKISLDNDSGN
jgi:hypothetical protein